MSIPNDISGDPFRGKVTQVGDRFEADKRIIKNVTAARSAYLVLRSDHLKRIALYAAIKGLIEGNPPYDPAELEAAGLQHISNFNDMSARATIERACLAYWNLLHNSQNTVRFKLRLKTPEQNEWAKIMSTNWDYAVKLHWPSFTINFASLTTQLVILGVSPTIFPNENDPRWRVVELNKFYIPDQQQSDLDLLTMVFVETEFTVQYLWQCYQRAKDKTKTATPWNAEQLGKLLVYLTATNMKTQDQPIDLMGMEQKFLNGDIDCANLYNDSVRIVSLFQKEYDGKISHYMFHRSYESPAPNTVGEDFIFKQEDQYKSISEALVLFTINPGEFTIHANKGLGHKIFSLAQAKIMLDCSVVDMAKWSSTPILKSASLNSKDVDQIRFYPGVPTNIGSTELLQNNLGANVQGVVSAAQYVSNLIQFNINYSGADSGSPDPDQGSLAPSQVRMMAFREFSVLKNNIMHFYNTFDKVIQNMTAKMLRSKPTHPMHKMTETWIRRCIEDGVPAQVFEIADTEKDDWKMPSHIEVYATRAAGAGSQVAHLMGLQELQTIAPSFGPREERAYKRDYVMATVGPEYIDTYIQESDDVDERAGGASLAGVENGIMKAGQPWVIFSPDNEHRAHVAVHMQLAQQIIQALQQQQMDPIEANSVFELLVPHTGQHLQFLSENIFAQEFFQSAKKAYDDVARYAALNKKNAAKIYQARIREQQQQEAATQTAMSDEEIKTMQAQNDEARKDFKLNAQNKRQDEQSKTKADIANRKVEGELGIKRKMAEGELAIKSKEASGKNFLENTSEADALANPSTELKKLNGSTPSPYDLEGGNGPLL